MRMEQVVTAGQHLSSASAVVVAEINVIDFGIGKIDSFLGQIQGEPIGPEDFASQNSATS